MANFIKPYDEETQKKLSDASGQNYDKEKITITKGGKTYNLYDAIQAAREDTEILPTLEKYGNLQTMEVNNKQMVEDFDNTLSLQDLLTQDRQLQDMFDALPIETKREFNNDFYQFKQYGREYFFKKAKAENDAFIEEQKKAAEKKSQPIKVKVVKEDTDEKKD